MVMAGWRGPWAETPYHVVTRVGPRRVRRRLVITTDHKNALHTPMHTPRSRLLHPPGAARRVALSGSPDCSPPGSSGPRPARPRPGRPVAQRSTGTPTSEPYSVHEPS